MKPYSQHIGFSLLELMAVIVIVGVLLAIGLPAFGNLRNDNCLTTNANRLVASLQYARSESAKLNRDVSLRPRNAGAARSWGVGWEIVTDEVDTDNSGACQGLEDLDGSGGCNNDAILKIVELNCVDSSNLTRGIQISNNVAVAAADPRFTYQSNGRLAAASTRSTFSICIAGYNGTNTGRDVKISAVGRPRTTRVSTCP
jgi:type IV fimbrial biogenesis protein FimT